MRHVTLIIILLAPALAGCEKPQAAPAQAQVEVRPMKSLKPVEPTRPAEPRLQKAPAPSPVNSTAAVAKPAQLATRPAPPPAQPRKYTVRRQDTLWSIAVRHLGDGKRWKEIQAANAGLDPAKLTPGQVITLPPR